MTVTHKALADALGSPKTASGVGYVLGSEAYSSAYDEAHQVVFSAIVTLARKYIEITKDHPAGLLGSLGECLDVAVTDGLDLLSQQDEAYEDARREEEPESPAERISGSVSLAAETATIPVPGGGFFQPITSAPKRVADMASDVVIEHLAGFGYTPDTAEPMQSFIELGFALAFRQRADLMEVARHRYTCLACGQDFGMELPFPDCAPVHGDDGSGDGCNDGLIVKTVTDFQNVPVQTDKAQFTVLITKVNGTTQARAYFDKETAGDALSELMEMYESWWSLEVVTRTVTTTAVSVHNAENALSEMFKANLPEGVGVLVVK